MRALCGAIITAGAFIALGLSALGVGLRYEHYLEVVPDHPRHLVYTLPLILALIIAIAGIIVGLGIAFVGLAYHHERRHRERLLEQRNFAGPSTTP